MLLRVSEDEKKTNERDTTTSKRRGERATCMAQENFGTQVQHEGQETQFAGKFHVQQNRRSHHVVLCVHVDRIMSIRAGLRELRIRRLTAST